MKNVLLFLLLFLCWCVACQNPSKNKHTVVVDDSPKLVTQKTNVLAVDSNKQTSLKANSTIVDSVQQKATKGRKKNRFKAAVENMSRIKYVLKTYEEVTSEQNFLNARISYLNQYRLRQKKPLLDTVLTTNIIQVRKAFVKGTVNLGGNMYARANLESWEFDSVAAALAMEKSLEKLRNRGHAWEDISKSPISYIRVDNELVFITPGGFYMLDKVSALKTFFQEQL